MSECHSSDDSSTFGASAERLLPLVYDELRKLAAARLANEKPGQTLQATDLVHEVFLRLQSNDSNACGSLGQTNVQWNGRGHFFGAAAEAMRRILIERARRKKSLKHGGGMQQYQLDAIEIPASLDSIDLIGIDNALQKLEEIDPRAAEIVKMRFFVGLTIPEIASALGVSPSTVDRQWAWARAWLHVELA